MSRSFCPECGGEVTVDADGLCHAGHPVELTAASVDADGELHYDFDRPGPLDDLDDPQPWVSDVDPTGTDGVAPPPDAPTPPPAVSAPVDEPAWVPDEHGPTPLGADLSGVTDDLAAAAAAAVDSLPADGDGDGDDDDDEIFSFRLGTAGDEDEDDIPGWNPPPSTEPIGTPPQPPPVPVDPPRPAEPEPDTEDPDPEREAPEDADFDFTDLEAAVSGLGGTTTPTEPPREPSADELSPATTFQDLAGQAPRPAAPPPREAATTPAPAPPVEPAPPPTAETPATPDPAAGAVDLSDFTARGGRSRGREEHDRADGRRPRKGRFRRG